MALEAGQVLSHDSTTDHLREGGNGAACRNIEAQSRVVIGSRIPDDQVASRVVRKVVIRSRSRFFIHRSRQGGSPP